MNLANFINTNTERFLTKPAIGFKKYGEWKTINWSMLRTTIFKTANALKNLGVKENDKVAIYSENSAEWIVSDLAIMALGGITVPIYATNTANQTLFYLKDAEIRVIIVGNQVQYDNCLPFLEDGVLDFIIASKKSIILKSEKSIHFEDFIKSESNQFEICEKNDDDLATIVYTSGTTGVPKGVMITHGNLGKTLIAHLKFLKFKNFTEETSLAFLPLSHIFERGWTMVCLYGGACVYFLENPKQIAEALEEIRPTMMCTVPRFFQKIYATIQDKLSSEKSSFKKKVFKWTLKIGKKYAYKKNNELSISPILKLKHYISYLLVTKKVKEKLGGRLWFVPCGGSALSANIMEFFDSIGLHITAGYGLTETTATLTCHPPHHYLNQSAGKPIGDVQIKISNEGEILVKGSSIMKGYYKRPDETQKVFTQDGWFKTGDIGYLKEGSLIITDRLKDLMKTSNGKYIAPQPIENMITNNNFIQQVMVIAENRPFVTALLVPNFELLKEKLKTMNIHVTSWKDIVNKNIIKDFYTELLNDIQKGLSNFEKIKKFVILPEEFILETGEITPTLKIKRNIILEKYSSLIESMYS